MSIIVLTLDIGATFNTGYYNNGILIMDKSRIARKYVRLGLWVDIFTILVTILSLTNISYNVNYLKLAYLWKIMKIQNADNLISKRLQLFRITRCLYIITKVVWVLVLLSHVLGIIFYLIDLNLLNKDYDPSCKTISTQYSGSDNLCPTIT